VSKFLLISNVAIAVHTMGAARLAKQLEAIEPPLDVEESYYDQDGCY
jgi:hypothetical protein